MADTGLASLPFAIAKTNRNRNTPVWTTRYRPSYVSRTASENRRKALVDYLAVAAGSRIDDNNFPSAVKHEREIRSVQKQNRGRNSLLTRERTDASMLQQGYRSQSPPATAPASSPSVFLTQMHSEQQAKHLSTNSFRSGKLSFLRSPRPPSPTSNLLSCSVNPPSNTPQFGNVSTSPTMTLACFDPSTSPSSAPPPNPEPYFSQWRKEFWGSEASSRGKILYFQVSRPALFASKPRQPPPPPQRQHTEIFNHQQPKPVTAESESKLENKESQNTTSADKQQHPKSSKENKAAAQPDLSWSEYHAVEVVFETADGSFPLSYVDLRPVSVTAPQVNAADAGEASENNVAESVTPSFSENNVIAADDQQTPIDKIADISDEISTNLELLTVSPNDDPENPTLITDEVAQEAVISTEGLAARTEDEQVTLEPSEQDHIDEQANPEGENRAEEDVDDGYL